MTRQALRVAAHLHAFSAFVNRILFLAHTKLIHRTLFILRGRSTSTTKRQRNMYSTGVFIGFATTCSQWGWSIANFPRSPSRPTVSQWIGCCSQWGPRFVQLVELEMETKYRYIIYNSYVLISNSSTLRSDGNDLMHEIHKLLNINIRLK